MARRRLCGESWQFCRSSHGVLATGASIWCLFGALFLLIALNGGEEEGVASSSDAIGVIVAGGVLAIIAAILFVLGRRLGRTDNEQRSVDRS
jgi:uncharacterized membrane protein YbhN (UPF0104 family)